MFWNFRPQLRHRFNYISNILNCLILYSIFDMVSDPRSQLSVNEWKQIVLQVRWFDIIFNIPNNNRNMEISQIQIQINSKFSFVSRNFLFFIIRSHKMLVIWIEQTITNDTVVFFFFCLQNEFWPWKYSCQILYNEHCVLNYCNNDTEEKLDNSNWVQSIIIRFGWNCVNFVKSKPATWKQKLKRISKNRI